MKKQLRIAVVAGETSGDILGAGLMRELKKVCPNILFQGIGGALMEKEGLNSDAEMHKLSIMGLDGLFGNIQEILSIRKSLEQSLLNEAPDLFIGIDAPDFNLTLEKRLKSKGISTIHYVSPTVWAWRSYRIFKIKQAVDLMLTLFPFEADYYSKRNVPVEYVGHPLAKTLNPNFDLNRLDKRLKNIADQSDARFVAVLPGSRKSEVEMLSDVFIQTIQRLKQLNSDVEFIVPLANERVAQQFHAALKEHNLESCGYIHLIDGHLSADAMRLSRVVLLASGTAALESAILGKPTVVAYKLSRLTYWFARLTSTVKHASMPNHLLEEPIVPEFLQEDANVENLSMAVHEYLSDEALYKSTCQKLSTIHPSLDVDSSSKAAAAIFKFLRNK